jgi:hypothetical protein
MIPTAEELLKDNFLLIENGKTCEAHTHLVVKQMIEFAKLHVEAALKEASENAKIINHIPTWDDDRVYKEVSKYSILNAYPLDLIK